jgi:hypothetical protein
MPNGDEARRALDQYDPNEMAIPEWKLVQKVGGDVAKGAGAGPGDFYNTVTGDIAKELNIVVVDIRSGRARWGADITNAGPECASMDAREGKSIFGDDCSKCEYRLDAPWAEKPEDRRTKCSVNYVILGIDIDRGNLPVMIRAHGISALPARQLITQLRTNRSLKGEYHRAVVNIKSLEKDTNFGKAYAFQSRITKLVTDEEKANTLRIESGKLLGAPIPLPEGRPDEEPEPEAKEPVVASEAEKAEALTAPAADESKEESPPKAEDKEGTGDLNLDF